MVNRAVESDCQCAPSLKLLTEDKLRQNLVMLAGSKIKYCRKLYFGSFQRNTVDT